MSFADYPRTFFAALTQEWGIVIVAAAIVLSVTMLCIKWKSGISTVQAAAFVVLAVYLLTVFAATVFARSPKGMYRCELLLFWSYREIIVHGKITLLWENIWNILLLLPYGFLLPYVNPCGMGEKGKAARVTILTGFLCSLMIELLQLILKRGLFEFDDMVHNTLGVGIGYFFYKLLMKHFKTK